MTVGVARGADLRARAQRSLVDGVSRGFNLLPGIGPVYVDETSGAHLRDVDGNRYVDCIMGWGSLLLGHDPPVMRDALIGALQHGFLHQGETAEHVELAELICRYVPSGEKVRFTVSGLEATLFAVRLARASTGRAKVVKLEGHFHGLYDDLAFATSAAPPGEIRDDGTVAPVPVTAGVSPDRSDSTLVVPFNDVSCLEAALTAHGSDVACLIMEPLSLNMGCVRPDPGYLEAVRELTRRHGIVLIFDEILTGFRVALGGAQELYGVVPDLVCLSKALGCGMPIAAVAGRDDLMRLLGPPGPVPMSGTHTARLLAVAGALAALRVIAADGFHARLERSNDRLVAGLRETVAAAGVPCWVDGAGGRVALYFGLAEAPRSLRDIAGRWQADYHARVFEQLVLVERLYGLLPIGSAPDPLTISTAHTDDVIDDIVERVGRAIRAVPYPRPA